MNGDLRRGELELRAILGNAHAWAGNRTRMASVKKALRWVAAVPTNTSGLLGEAWMKWPTARSPVVTMHGQPDAWSHALFYLATLRAYGKTHYRFS